MRLAPQLLDAAELRERQQQMRIPRAGMQPFLGLFDLASRPAAAYFAVEVDQILVPVLVERDLDHVQRGVVAAARHERARGRARDEGIRLVFGRHLLPVFQQRAVVFGAALQILGIGRAAQLGRHGGFQRVAAGKLIEQTLDLVPLAGQLARAQFQPQEAGMLRRDRAGRLQRGQRAARVLRFQTGFGLEQLRRQFGALLARFAHVLHALR